MSSERLPPKPRLTASKAAMSFSSVFQRVNDDEPMKTVPPILTGRVVALVSNCAIAFSYAGLTMYAAKPGRAGCEAGRVVATARSVECRARGAERARGGARSAALSVAAR